MNDTQLYLHLGLHKTGTTVLQQAVFPLLLGERYLGKPSNRPFLFQLARANSSCLMISCESTIGMLLEAYKGQIGKPNYLDLQLNGISRLGALLPHSKIILGVRRHPAWILSVYKHYLKYGGTRKFDQFFSPSSKDACSVMHWRDFLLVPRLEKIIDAFDSEPFVFDHDDLRSQPENLLRGIAGFLGVSWNEDLPQLPSLNEGVNDRQALLLRKLNRMYSCLPSKATRCSSRLKISPFALATLNKWGGSPLRLNDNTREEIELLYADDWEQASTHFYRSRECAL